MKRFILFVTVIVLLFLLRAGLSAAQPPVNIDCEENYIVQANDWLSKIAEKYYGDIFAFPVIVEAANADANDKFTDIIDPNLIEPGWVLCIPSDQSKAQLMDTRTAPVPAGLSLSALANATYSSEWLQNEIASLTSGEYSEAAASGAASDTKVIMLIEETVYGQLDGQDVAAVILVTAPPGSGRFYYLHLMANQNGQPTEIANTILGDRIQINSIRVENNQIVVNLIQAGPNDPLCCPSQQVIKTLAWQDEQLLEASSRVIDIESAATRSSIVRIVWKWLGFADPAGQNNIVVPDPDNYRFELLTDGTFAVKADCNVASGSYTLSGNKLTLQLEQTTMAECKSGSLYDQYLLLLGQVADYLPTGENLGLNLAADRGKMNFSRLQAVTGTIIGPVNATLPGAVTAEVKVMDVTEGGPGKQIGGAWQQNIITFPIHFEADYTPQAVVPGNTYVLEVAIQDRQGNLLYQNSRTYPVLTQGRSRYDVVVFVKAVK